MTPKKFLIWGGWVLLVLGVLGFILPDRGELQGSLLGSYLWFDSAENWAHTVLGIVALLLGYWGPAGVQKPVVVIVGLVALFFGITGFMVAGRPAPNWYGVTNLENPLDNLVHLVVGIWALWAGLAKSKGSMAGAPKA